LFFLQKIALCLKYPFFMATLLAGEKTFLKVNDYMNSVLE